MEVQTRENAMRPNIWTDERIALLTKLHKDGLSASEIAQEMGLTRNTVCGKLHRMNPQAKPRTSVKGAPKRPYRRSTKHNRSPDRIDVDAIEPAGVRLSPVYDGPAFSDTGLTRDELRAIARFYT